MMDEINMISKSQIIDKLKKAGVTPTQQRVEIGQILFAKPQHMSADQVLSVVNQTGPVVSKATIYNTLGLFAKKGLVREVIVDPSKVFYDSNTSEHHHFYDIDTGSLMDINNGQLRLESMPVLPDGTEAEGIDIVIRVRKSMH
ncbi:MAG: transcriptional repressor [Gammaproteobacteria bacterium]|nr:transcriptional repressor [Gammaproteobacteria bacterium]